MNNKQIDRLEKKYSLTFPSGYRHMLLAPPEHFFALLKHDEKECPGQTPFFWDHRMIDEVNQMMCDPDHPEYFGFDPNDESKPWPSRYFIIGSDVGGNFYCIMPKSNTSRVYFWCQGDTTFSRFSDDMAGFVKRIFKSYGEVAAMDCEPDVE
ncbi:SMI1/KNR4 family protein [bacterium]|nr:SMI1/KNR4 family protein [bacterium]